MKKFGKLLICLLLTSSFAFSGCSLVQRNVEKYLNRTVATAGEIEISKQDLISAYNSVGYQYVQSQGYTTEKALKTTIDSLIDREILVRKAKEIITENNGEMLYGTKIIFNKNVWQNAVWKETFESVNSQIKEIEDEIKLAKGMEISKEDEEEEKEFEPFKEYEKKVKYEDGVWSLIEPELEPAEEVATTVGDFVQDETGDVEISQKAFKRYIKKLTLNYKNKHLKVSDLKTVSEDDFANLYSNLELSADEKIAFIYELERIQEIYNNNKYISEFQNVYERYVQEIDVDFNKKVVSYYKQLVGRSYENYEQESLEDSYSKYVEFMSDTSNDNTTIYYHKDYGVNESGEKKAFVAVSHVLIKLSDEQLEEIKTLKSDFESGIISQEQYDASYQAVLKRTKVKARDEEGNETDEEKTVEEVYAEIQTTLASISSVRDKAIAFNKFIYKYGQDGGMTNKDSNGNPNKNTYYAVNLDTTVQDKMVKEFADASRALALEAEDGGNISEAVFVSQDNYSGYHIIFNAGIFKNELTIEQVEGMDYNSAAKLYNTPLKLRVDKSLYDLAYEVVYASTWSNYQRSIIETAKNNLEIVYYTSAYEDLF
ncbi:MAG TPA: hypothetical protein DCO89_03395 [Clostridiales bacterium]|nr:hypothetical protein [Clostridiales bacterium]